MLYTQWILNVCYGVIGAPIANFVRQRVDERNQELAERQDFNVAIDPEILSVIKASTAISTQKGNSAMLLKVGSKRRRTKAEMDEFRAQQENQFEAMAAKDEQISALEEELRGSKRKQERAQSYESVMQQMLAAGVLVENIDGTFSVRKE